MMVCITVLDKYHRVHFEKSGPERPVTHYGCYKCGKVYLLFDNPIKIWTNDGQTALCPVCEWQTVIPMITGLKFDDKDMQILGKQNFDLFDWSGTNLTPPPRY